MKQRVSLCMIVRDEEANLGECLESVAGLFDEIVVVDTGSTDNTKHIAGQFGAKVIDFKWIDDFAAARNESKRHATGDWIFWLDADDRIDGSYRHQLATLLASLSQVDGSRSPVYHMLCNSCMPDCSQVGVVVNHGRLFPNRSDIWWRGSIHEAIAPTPDGAELERVQTAIAIRHDGYANPEKRARKIQRNARLIRREYLLDPDNPTMLYYLARQRIWRDRIDECLRLLRRSIDRDPGNTLSTTPQCFVMMAECHFKRQRLEEAVRATAEGLGRFPNNMMMLYQRGSFLREAKDLDEAANCLERVLRAGREALLLSGMQPEEQLPVAHLTLSRIYRDQGKFPAAEHHLRIVTAHYPQLAEGHFLLSQLMLHLGRRGEVEALISTLRAMPAAQYECAMLQALVHCHAHDFAATGRSIDAAIALDPGKPYPWILLSFALFQAGDDWERCREVHEKVLAMDPRQTVVRRRLEKVNAVLAQKSARAAAAAANANASALLHAGVMRIGGLGHAFQVSHS